jgi:hypothetical protein
VHRECNEVGGTVNGLLSDGTDQVAVHITRNRDAGVAEQLAQLDFVGEALVIVGHAALLQ